MHPSRPRPSRLAKRPLCLEQLEDRLAPANTVDVGGLRFISNAGFETTGSTYNATSGYVSVGYVPSGTESFLPLLSANLSDTSSSFAVFDTPTTPTFALRSAPVLLSVIAGSPGTGIPIWQKTDSTLVVDINQLTGTNGYSIPSTVTAVPFEVANVDFALSGLIFANPSGGDTSDAQVLMQGTASFDKVPIVQDLGVTAKVEGANYVVAQSGEIDLTGLKVNVPIPTTATVRGMKLTGNVDITYTRTGNEFAIGGGVFLTSPADSSGKVALNSVGAELQLTFANGGLEKLGFSIEESFSLYGLTVSTAGGQPLGFNWNRQLDQFECSGGLQFEFSGNSILVNFSNQGAPGIVISNGQLSTLNGYIAGSITIAGATLSTQGITVQYDRDQGQFEIYGGLTLQVPTGAASQSLAVTMGSASNPGLIIQGGEMTQLNLEVSRGISFDVYGLALTVTNAGVDWQKGNTLLLSGTFGVDFKSVQTTLTLGADGKPGLEITNGTFIVDSIKIELENIPLGPATLQDLVVSYTGEPGSYDLVVSLYVVMPGNWPVGGIQAEFDIVQGRLDTISIDVSLPAGELVVGETGLSIVDIHAKVTNIESPSQIVVTGGIGAVWGDQFNLFGQQVYAFHVTGNFTADADELIVEAAAQLGAYSNDNGTTWQGVAGQGDAKLTLDWGAGLYSLHLEVDGLFAVFDLTGDFTFEAGKDIRFLAEVDVVVPNFVPFIGGDRLGGFGFFFDHTLQAPVTTTVAAWIELHAIWNVEVGFELVFDPDHPQGQWSLIGASTIDGFKQETQPKSEQAYTYTADLASLIPSNATAATLHADWSRPAAGVTLVGAPTFRVQHTVGNQTVTITEDQFENYGIALIADPAFDTPTTRAIQIVGDSNNQYAPLTGDYKLLIDVEAVGGNPFPNYGKSGSFYDLLAVQGVYHLPKPIFGKKTDTTPYAPPVPQTPATTFSVSLLGNMDEGLLAGGKAQVSVYRVLAQGPQQQPVLIGSVAATKYSADGDFNWQAKIDVPIDDLEPLPYVLYAVVNDGLNVPVKTGLSAAFTPAFAVQGSVSNQVDDALTGWSVFLDYNQNGTHEDNEPITQTSTPDGKYAFAPTFATGSPFDPVPINKPFNVQLVVPSNQFVIAPAMNPVTNVTFDGLTTKVVNFSLQERTAIKGVAFNDDGNNGNPGDGTPLAGATVYLDANGNGLRDPGEQTQLTGADGSYAFRNLQAGAYTVGLDVNGAAPAAAYVVPAGTVGNQGQAAALGMAFTVTNPIDVTSLGVFDSHGDGLAGTLTATLYDLVTRKAVATLQFTPDDPGTLVGGSRVKALAQPVTLYAGFQGLIVADGFSAQDPWGGNGTNPPWTLNGSNNLTFTGTGVSGPAGQFPTGVAPGTVANPYAAGTFLYSDPVRVQTSPSGGTYVVTLDNTGFDVKSGNDFGVQPLSSVSGTVTGAQPSGGDLGPASPLAGVTVQLLQNGTVVGSTTADASGKYSFTGLRPGPYDVAQLPVPGYRQYQPFGGANFQLQGGGGPAFQLPNGLLPQSSLTADIDGNGQLDLVVVGSNGAPMQPGAVNVFVYYNGNFNQPVGLSGGGYGTPWDAVAVNVANGTGLPDVVLLYLEGPVSVLSNQAGSLTSGTVQWNLPGDSGQSYVQLVNGHFTSLTPGTNQFAALQTNSDTGGGVVLFFPGGGNQAAEPLGTKADMAAGDINGDGYTDLALVHWSASPTLLIGDGTGKFTQTSVGSLPGGMTVAIGDINGDGRADLAVSNFSEDGSQPTSISYALQDTNGGFSSAVTPGVGSPDPFADLFLQDVNGDYRPDLVWLTQPDNDDPQVYVALNTGTTGGWFTTGQLTAWGLAVGPGDNYSLSLGDLNDDDLVDLAVIDQSRGPVNLVYNQTTFLPPPPLTVQVPPAQGPTGVDFANVRLPLAAVGDFGFETPAVGSGTTAYLYANQIPAGSTPWTFTGSSGVSGNNSAFTSGNPVAPQGSQVGFLQGQGSFSQTAFFEAGTYSINFQAAQRAGQAQAIQVQVDGLGDVGPSGGFKPVGSSYSPYATTGFTIATAGNYKVTFVGLNPNGGDNTAFLDAIAIQPVAGVPDFGFEAPPAGNGPAAYAYRPIGSPWTFTGMAGVSGNGSAFTSANPFAPQGNQVAFLQQKGVISQSVYFPAGTYSLSFQAAQRGGQAQAFQVLVDGVAVGPQSGFQPASSTYTSFTTDSFTVGAGYHTIQFVGLNPNGGDNTAFIDAVTVQPAQSTVDHTLTMPSDVGPGDWTVRVHEGRLEVHDRNHGLWDSRLLSDLRSLTVIGSDGRADRVTLDLREAPLPLAGGFRFLGGAGPGDRLRLVLGPQDDHVVVLDGAATVNGLLALSWAGVDELSIDGGAGNDVLMVTSVTAAGPLTVLDGGAGDDVLHVLGGRNVLLGRDGNDILVALGGRNLLIGGAGSDTLMSRPLLGAAVGSLLIGGSVSFDDDEEALRAVLAEWSSDRPLHARIANLRDGTGGPGRLNGGFFLNDETVIDDGVRDVLFSDLDHDWWLPSLTDIGFNRRR